MPAADTFAPTTFRPTASLDAQHVVQYIERTETPKAFEVLGRALYLVARETLKGVK